MIELGLRKNNEGWNLLKGIGCIKDENAAIRCFQEAAAMGNTTAMVNLGNIYEARQDYQNAYEWYQEAAFLGDEIGIFNVANMYHWGWYVEKNYEKAWHTFKQL